MKLEEQFIAEKVEYYSFLYDPQNKWQNDEESRKQYLDIVATKLNTYTGKNFSKDHISR